MKKIIIFFMALLLINTAMAINAATITDFGDGKIIKDCVAVNAGESVYNAYKNLDNNRDDIKIDFDGDKIPPYNPFIKGINGYDGHSLSLTKFEGWNFWVTDNNKNDFTEPPELAPGWGMGIGDYKINSPEVIGLRYSITEFNDDWTIKTPPERPAFESYEKICEKLIINEVTAYVDGNKNTLSGGEKIKDVRPQSELKLKIEVKNLYDASIEIRDIAINAVIKKIDDGDELKEESGKLSLNAGETETEIIEFSIPLEVKDNTYDLTIEIEGKDSRGVEYKKKYEYPVELKKEKHDISIRKAELVNPLFECSRTTYLEVNAMNMGTDEEEVALTVNNAELNLNKQLSFKLDNDPFDSDSKYSASFMVTADKEQEAGTYPITVRAGYSAKTSERTVNLEIKDCENNVKETEQNTLPQSPPAASHENTRSEKAPTTAQDKAPYENHFLVISVLGMVIIAGFGAFFITKLVK